MKCITMSSCLMVCLMRSHLAYALASCPLRFLVASLCLYGEALY
jgi:hypothetical protein